MLRWPRHLKTSSVSGTARVAGWPGMLVEKGCWAATVCARC